MKDCKSCKDDGFMRGYAVALVILNAEVDGPSYARRVIDEGGFVLSDFKGKGIDPADMRILKGLPKR